MTKINTTLINSKINNPLKKNNFDLLRFVFAFIVLLVHAYILSNYTELSILSVFLSSEIAVKSFFVVSGFLIFMSYENSPNFMNYFQKRFRRIYPAYFFTIIGCAILGALLSTKPWPDILVPVAKYVTFNLLFLNFLQPTLPGLFDANPLQAINGALWTLKVEVMFYLAVPFFVMLFRKYGRLNILAAGFVISVTYSIFTLEMARQTGSALYLELQRQLPGQLSFFLAGAACYYYLDIFSRNKFWLIGFAILSILFYSWIPTVVFEPFALAVVVIYLACLLPWHWDFGKYGDFSYGIYIVHFPVLQSLIACRVYSHSPWLFLVSAIILILALSFIFWHFIEKPFLRKSSHYVTNKQ
jgi:peptidoglycan/LPS O-acetylase OafA/YrhL